MGAAMDIGGVRLLSVDTSFQDAILSPDDFFFVFRHLSRLQKMFHS